MNKLWVQLTLAFVAITLLSVALVALLANSAATDQFQAYLTGQQIMSRAGLVDDLAGYYRQNGNWNGVAIVMSAAEPGMMGRGRGAMRGAAAFMLADANGAIVYGDHIGPTLTASEQAAASPIDVGGTIVGYLLVTSPGRVILNQAQQAFLDQLQRNLIFAGLATGSLAIILGLLISRALATPLAGLSRAAHAYAERDWAYRVKPRGTQEVVDLTHAFNQMAESLQRAEKMRRDLMADIAHELRTPVTVIQGNLRAILDGVYPLEKSEVATLYDETLLLNRLIDDLRELTLAEAGQLQLHMRDVDIGAVIRATVDHFAASADSQGVTLDVQAATNLPYVLADMDRLAQVVRILLTNALRHTPAGGRVTLAVDVATHATKQQLRINVTDTGEGIPADDMQHVFDCFYRSDASRSRDSGGTGLGLAIAKTLVEAMSGSIGAESILGIGSHFWFTIPVSSRPD